MAQYTLISALMSFSASKLHDSSDESGGKKMERHHYWTPECTFSSRSMSWAIKAFIITTKRPVCTFGGIHKYASVCLCRVFRIYFAICELDQLAHIIFLRYSNKVLHGHVVIGGLCQQPMRTHLLADGEGGWGSGSPHTVSL